MILITAFTKRSADEDKVKEISSRIGEKSSEENSQITKTGMDHRCCHLNLSRVIATNELR